MGHFINGRVVVCDTESTGLRTWAGDQPFMFSFASNRADEPVSFEFDVDPFTRRVNYNSRPLTFAKLKRFFADPTIAKVFHNSKHDVRMIQDGAGMKVRGEIGDTELKLRVCDSTRETYELKPVCHELFDVSRKDQKDLHKAVAGLRTRAKKLGFKIATKQSHGAKGIVAADAWLIQHAERILTESLVTLKSYTGGNRATRRKLERDARDRADEITAMCSTYAELDAVRALLLDTFLEPKLDEYGIRHIYEMEMKDVWPVTYAMETRGVYINRKVAERGRARAVELIEDASQRIEKLCRKAKSKLTPSTFPNSYPQKRKYFIDELKLEPLHFAKKTGNPKLDKSFLEHYADTVPMCGAIQDKGKATKAKGTYFDTLLQEAGADGIFHGSFQQIGAKTGRFSARLLQQVPKRGKCRKCFKDLKIAGWDGAFAICKSCGKATTLDILLEVRRPFGPRPGFRWYPMDFQQIEARIFADYADEKFMLRAFKRGQDVYENFADVISNETGLPITRQDTKAIFLGKLYGLGRGKLIKQITDAAAGQVIEDETAANVVQVFDERFPRVSEFMRETIAVAKAERAVYNRYGQRVDIKPPYFDPTTGKTFDESYRGVNYIIQSSAARLMKAAMVKCHRYLQSLGFGWLVMTIHDELIFEFEEDRRPKKVIQHLADLMSNNEGKFPRVKTPVDVSKVTGKGWLQPMPVDFVVCS